MCLPSSLPMTISCSLSFITQLKFYLLSGFIDVWLMLILQLFFWNNFILFYSIIYYFNHFSNDFSNIQYLPYTSYSSLFMTSCTTSFCKTCGVLSDVFCLYIFYIMLSKEIRSETLVGEEVEEFETACDIYKM